MNYIGIDPGRNGWICVLGGPEGLVAWHPIPWLGREPDHPQLQRIVRGIGHPAFAAVERQQAYPGIGVAAAFGLGAGYHAILAALAAAGIGFEAVLPRKWKQAMGLVLGQGRADAKKQSILLAQRLFPGADLRRPGGRKASDDRAEALLLAEYARRIRP